MADKKDYYEVLGVDKGVSDDDLKKAYRKAAKKYHPDLHPGDAAAEQSFKEVNEAYEVLSDKEKRARYDQFGHAGVDPNFNPNAYGGGFSGFGGFDDLGDILGSMFGGGFGGFGGGRRSNPNAPRRGGDIQVTVNLSFEEAAKGCTREIDVQKIETCDECGGSGAKKGTARKTCPHCKGTGKVTAVQNSFMGQVRTVQPCPNCKGAGTIIEDPCPKCNGKGRIRHTVKKTINIPAGIDDGEYFSLPGGGDAGANGGPAGDLHIIASVRPHPIFERNGYDVYCEVPITFTQAALGAEITVPTLDGKVKFSIHEGAQPGDEFKFRGKGIQRFGGSGRGDQYVRISVEIPKDLTKEQKQKLRDFEKTVSEKNYKKQETFFEKIKRIFD